MNRFLRARVVKLEADRRQGKASEPIILDLRPRLTREQWMWVHNPSQAAAERAAGRLPMAKPSAAYGAWCQRHGLWPDQNSTRD